MYAGGRVSYCQQARCIRSHNADSMLGQRLRWWINIEPALGQCLVFAGPRRTVICVGSPPHQVWDTDDSGKVPPPLPPGGKNISRIYVDLKNDPRRQIKNDQPKSHVFWQFLRQLSDYKPIFFKFCKGHFLFKS